MNLPNYTLGGGIKHYKNLIAYYKDTKQFYDTSHKLFNSVYDSIFGLKWNGGRVCSPADTLPLPDLFEVIKSYNELGIGFNWSFTNTLLTEEDLKDPYCNLVLEATNNCQNGVILVSPLLREHIKKNFPKMKIIFSVCNGLKTLDEYKKEIDNNDLVVLHPDFNHDYNFLEQLPQKEKIEVMVNDICAFGCPFRKKHYDFLSLCAKVQSTNPIIHDPVELDYGKGQCDATKNGYIKDERNRLTQNDIEYMLNMGFKVFKIIGREHNWDYYYKKDLRPNLEQFWLRKVIRESEMNLHI